MPHVHHHVKDIIRKLLCDRAERYKCEQRLFMSVPHIVSPAAGENSERDLCLARML